MGRTPKRAFEPQFRCECLDLAFSRFTISEDFLERDDIGIETRENICDAFDRRPSIDTSSFMDVVGDDPHTEILPRSNAGISRTVLKRAAFRHGRRCALIWSGGL